MIFSSRVEPCTALLNPKRRAVRAQMTHRRTNHDRHETDDQWPRAPDFAGSSRSGHKPAQDEFTEKDSVSRGRAVPAQLRLDPEPLSLQSAARFELHPRAWLEYRHHRRCPPGDDR